MVGKTISHYQILEKLGEGGMGIVYRAEDLNLQRAVALKFLSPHTLDDAEGRERFLREARAAASLDHPNVCTVYEIGEQDGHAFLVMAYVEGHTVREKVTQRPLKLSEALDIAIQAGEGLRAAHEKGIVHRDVKSANLMVTPEGNVKVMDFGLAHLAGQSGLTRSRATLGTAAYMSPEQAQHQPVDCRSDIWSLGVVIYEMLTGRTPFEGEHEAAVLYSVIHESPEPVTALRVGVPVAVDRVLGKAMAKEPGARYQHIDEFLVDLRALRKGLPVSTGGITPSGARSRRMWMIGGLAAVGFVVFITVLVIFWRGRQAGGAGVVGPRTEFSQLTSEPGIEWFPSLSPDGKWLVYGGASGSGRHIYLQGVGGQNRLDLTRDSASDDDQPAFSPDGEQIAFHSNREGGGIFVMGRTGEAVRRVTSVGFNPAWSPDGTHLAFNTEIVELYPQNAVGRSELWTVEVSTGEMRRLFEGDAVLANWSPHHLRIAYTNRLGTPAQGDVWTIPVTGGPPTPVTSDPARDWNPAWSPDGKYIYFASDRGGSMNLWRVAVDEASGKTRGQPEALTTPAPYLAHVNISADGRRIVYASALISANIQQLSLDASFDPKGEPAWVTTGSRRWSTPDPSPDGDWVAFYSLTQPEGQLYLTHPDGTGLRQVTNGATDRMPRWSSDGKWIACFSNRSGRLEVWRIRPDGSGQQQLTIGGGSYLAWSPDGSRIATNHSIMEGQARTGVILFEANRPWKEQTPEMLPPLDSSSDNFMVNSWSLDGQFLTGQVSGNHPGIAVYSLATRAYQRLTDFGEWPVWLPDNRRVLFVADGKDFFIADTRSRQVRKIFSVTRDVIGPPRLTRDGKKAYYSRRVTESDIWLCTLR